MTDVLYRVKGPCEPELRYSLRSLANIEHDKVWLVGDAPKWLQGVEVIPTKRRFKWFGLMADLYQACLELGDRDVVLMDDDFYVLQAQTVQPYHRGPLVDHAKTARGSYGRSLLATDVYLKGKGCRVPLSYDLHLPLPLNTKAMAEVLAPVALGRVPMQARSLYGNLVGIGGKQVADVKGTEPRQGGYLSSTHAGIRYLRPMLDAMFPTPSRYEA